MLKNRQGIIGLPYAIRQEFKVWTSESPITEKKERDISEAVIACWFFDKLLNNVEVICLEKINKKRAKKVEVKSVIEIDFIITCFTLVIFPSDLWREILGSDAVATA